MKKFSILVSLVLTMALSICGFVAVNVFANDSPQESNVVLFDGSSIDGFFEAGHSPTADTIELTTEAKYIKTGTSSILWSLNNEQEPATPDVAVHNLVMPVNDDISEYKTLEITYYVSDWANWSYYGLSLHYKEGTDYTAGSHNLPLDKVSEIGWNTIQVDLTSVPAKYLNLYNLFFNINMNVTEHIDVQIVIDRISLSTEEIVDVYEKQKNIVNGSTVEGMFESSVNPTADTVELTEDYRYINTGKSSILWKLDSQQTLINSTSAHNLVMPINADMSEYDTIVIKFYISEVIPFEFFGFQLHYSETATTPVVFDTSNVVSGWNTYVADISTVPAEQRNLLNLFFTANVNTNDMKDLVIAIDDVTFYKTIQEKPDYSDLPDSVVVVNSDTAAFLNEQVDYDTLTKTQDATYVAEGSTSSILWNISKSGTSVSDGTLYVHNMVMPVAGAVEGDYKDYSGYETLTIKFYVSSVEKGFSFIGIQLHNSDGATALPLSDIVAGWNTKILDITTQNLKLFNIFFTINLTADQNSDLIVAVDSVVFNKTPAFNGEFFMGEEDVSSKWYLSDSSIDVDGNNVDEISYSTDYAMVNNGSFVWNIVEDAPIIEAANIYVHNLHIPVNLDVSKYNLLELVFYVSDWDGFSFFGLQIVDNKFINGVEQTIPPLAIADIFGVNAGWNRVTIDLTLVSKRLDLNQLFWTVNLTPEQNRDITIAINSIKFLTSDNPATTSEDLDVKVVYDGSTLLNCDAIGTDSTELVTSSEYIQTGDSALKFNITKEATNGHNIVIPVNANCVAYNQLDVTMYVSDWTSFTYFGWQLHYVDGGAQGGLVLHEIFNETIPAGGAWVTFTYNLTDYTAWLNLHNLFFTVNFAAGSEKDMFLVIDNVTLRITEQPTTGYSIIRDDMAPSISYIKYYNLENEVAVGDEIDLSVVRVTDNKDLNPTLDITVTLNNEAVELANGKFTVEKEGTYVAKFVAKDSSGNEAVVELKFIASAGEGGGGASTAKSCGSSIGLTSSVCLLAVLTVFAALILMKKRA